MAADPRLEIAKSGTLRAAINRGNPLLVTRSTQLGEPVGVAPDMACAIADRMGVAISLECFSSPGEIADAIGKDAWDICFIAAEPERAKSIAFTDPYVEIEATFMVPPNSPVCSIADIDRVGTRIAVSDRSAYDLYLSRTLKHAELHRAKGIEASLELFLREGLDALAGLRPALINAAGTLSSYRVLDGRFTTVQQAIGTKPENTAAKAFLDRFVSEAKSSGLVASLIDKNGVASLLQVPVSNPGGLSS